MIKTIKYAFLDNNNEIVNTAMFEPNCSEQDLINSMSIFETVKYIKAEDDLLAGVGNLWSEENQKFYPKNIFINMSWDFNQEKFIPIINKPENTDISLGDWIWNVEDGEWDFIPPIPSIEGREDNKWIWDKTNQEWIYSE
jgi:hypothetical protein